LIIRPRPTFLQLFFVMRGSVVPRIAPVLAGFALYSCAVVWLTHHLRLDLGPYGLGPFTLLGVTLSIFLGFRTNTAYDRWWEARKLWGQLVFEIRNLTRVTFTVLPGDRRETRLLLKESLAFCHFLRGQLRGVDADREALPYLDPDLPLRKGSNAAEAVLLRMGARIGTLKSAGAIDSMDFRILDERLSALAALHAGCERIANTPVPFAYTLLLLRSAYLFCLLLPFGLAGPLGWATPVFTVLIAYTLFGPDALSAELEDPFGTEANDLPLDRMCRVCEISVLEALGEPAPAQPTAVDYYSS
jgi:ion channel-forming bestrophin family protein